MAVFGAPLTHEDHVRRALLAALGIQRALSGAGGAADRQRLDLPVRIGKYTGAVVFGPISDRLPMDPTVIGDASKRGLATSDGSSAGHRADQRSNPLLARAMPVSIRSDHLASKARMSRSSLTACSAFRMTLPA